MTKKILPLIFAATFALSACQMNNGSWPWGQKQTVGATGGAVLGGLVGSKVGKGSGQLWATGAGALLGAFVGSSIGQSLDQADRMYHAQAVEKAYNAPLNQEVTWSNPDSGHGGSVTPVREGHQASTGNICRQYKQTIIVDGQSETAYGTACQNPDGTWDLVN